MDEIEEDWIIPLDEIEGPNANHHSHRPINIEQELECFREQWQRELQSQAQKQSPGPEGVSQKKVGGAQEKEVDQQPSIEEQAKYLFLQGVNAEQSSRLDEAIQYYRRAVQLVPDIEFRIQDFKPRPTRERFESESSVEASDTNDDDEDLENLLPHVQKMKAGDSAICGTEVQQRTTHIAALPFELLVYIVKWVVSMELDVTSLEQLSRVSRGFYICCRDKSVWRLICRRVWGRNCGTSSNYGSYRDMFLKRPHLRHNGIYISKLSYFRQGEKGLDNFYKPYHLVEYYRYMRFFPEGQVLIFTAPEDPYNIVPKLRTRGCRLQGILHGYYRMDGDQVTAVLKRRQVDYNVTSYKYQQNRQNQNDNDREQTFNVELCIKNAGRKIHSQLVWKNYSIHTVYKSSGQETVAEFELKNTNYPPLIFSRVKSYTALSESPLQ